MPAVLRVIFGGGGDDDPAGAVWVFVPQCSAPPVSIRLSSSLAIFPRNLPFPPRTISNQHGAIDAVYALGRLAGGGYGCHGQTAQSDGAAGGTVGGGGGLGGAGVRATGYGHVAFQTDEEVLGDKTVG